MTNHSFIDQLKKPNPSIKVILAPMDGYSDFPFRQISKTFGNFLSYSEFINAMDVLNDHPRLEYRLAFSDAERPFGFQIFDDDTERILKAALILREREPDFIDLNFGCSAKNVTNRGAGSALLKSPEKISRIVKLLSKNLDIPVSAKIRLGWDDASKNYLEVSRRIEDAGASFLAVHGRTKDMAYTGQADWTAIAEIKQLISIPVIANGDIGSNEDIKEAVHITGANAVMIGREAIGNPWLLGKIDRKNITPTMRMDIITNHLGLMIEHYGPHFGIVFFRKHLQKYLAGMQIDREKKKTLLTDLSSEIIVSQLSEMILTK